MAACNPKRADAVKKILVVDDQKELRELISVTLRTGDHEILEAANGRSAVEVARVEKPDLIIMDVMMPGEIDGLEATKRLKKDPVTNACKILILSIKGQEIDREKGYASGADAYYVKPFSPDLLMKKVDDMLG